MYFNSEKTEHKCVLTEEKMLLKLLGLKLRLMTKASYFLGKVFYFHWQGVFKTFTSGQKTMLTQKLSNQT